MLLRDRLTAMVQAKLKELGYDLGCELTDDTPLISSGLFDSLALLNVAVWIEGEIDSQVDIMELDLGSEWDTIGDILNFIKKHSGQGSDKPTAR